MFSAFPHINLPGDGGGDEGAAALLEQLDATLRLRLQLVDLPALLVQVRDDGMLLIFWWNGYRKSVDVISVNSRNRGFCGVSREVNSLKRIPYKAWQVSMKVVYI